MDPVLIVDCVCNIPYDLETLNLGGTEATVIRIAEKLSETVPIVVMQHNRKETTRSQNVTYAPLSPQSILDKSWQAIVVLRNPEIALQIKKGTKKRVFLWLHDLVNLSILRYLKLLSQLNIVIITVSDFVKQQLIDLLKIDPFLAPLPNILRIYNPIDDHMNPDATPYDANRLAFISSPHKGLEYTLSAFKFIHQQNPQFELIVTNPGYQQPDLKQLDIPGVKYLGTLSHSDNMRLIRSALCVLHLNHVHPETFGLIFAEANSVGTPVLTHPIGASPEVLQNKEQLINTYDVDAVTKRLLQWHQGNRPVVGGNDSFRLSNVIEQWVLILTN